MRTSFVLSVAKPRRQSLPKGVALVIVLCLLVLISGIVVAFFSSVSSEYLTAKSNANGSTGKELADSAVQLVMGQIQQATTSGSTNSICWASQPGMIRTWGETTGTASSNKLGFYKLYSSGTMVVDATVNSGFKPEDDIPTNSWAKQPALYTDLNSPVVGTTGTSYPIIDPSAAALSGSYSTVEGFAVNATGSSPIASGATANPVPMPVKWIYVLRDGTMIAPDATSTGSSVTFSATKTGTKVPTATNPIVGRVAFWTDDETCKLNINTACGGTYWEQPMFTSDMDMAFSRYKPVANEFNRYPGHPATTSLLPVFWSLDGMKMSSPYDYMFPSLDNSQYSMTKDIGPFLTTSGSTTLKNLLKFVPRNTWGGSMMGTNPTGGYGVTTGTSAVVADSDRLYASVDEALFGYTYRGDSDAATSGTNAFAMSNAQLKKLRFFLTATSRAPETNPFNQPKVGIWPVPELVANRSASDKLIAFCSTLNPSATLTATNTYFFTRNNAQSDTADWLPGSRNDKLFDYLDTLLQQPMPGFGRKMSDRYTVDGDRHILALIYDYIRSTLNLLDTSFGYTMVGTVRQYNNTFLGVANNNNYYGFGQVIPIRINKNSTDYKGVGRFPLIKSAGLLFMARASNEPPLTCFSNGLPVVYSVASSGTDVTSSGTAYHPYQNPDGTLTSVGVSLALSGSLVSVINPNHLWTSGTVVVGSLVSQFKASSGLPVLAVTGTNVTDVFPIFSSVTGTTNKVTGANIAFIDHQYPTIYGFSNKYAFWGVSSGTTQVISSVSLEISGTFAVAVTTSTTSTSGTMTNQPQTHAGMPYLTVQSPTTGAFNANNPRYQGKDTASTLDLPSRANMPPGTTEVQALLIVDPVNVAPGSVPIYPKYQVQISGQNVFTVGASGTSLGFSGTSVQSSSSLGASPYYNLGMETISVGGFDQPKNPGPETRQTGGANQTQLNFISKAVTLSGTTFSFNGGDLTVKMYAPPVTVADSVNPTSTGSSTLVQTYTINFPQATGMKAFPTPRLPFMPDNGACDQRTGQNPHMGHEWGGCHWDINNSRGDDLTNSDRRPADPVGVPSTVGDLCSSSLLTCDPSSKLSQQPSFGTGTSGMASGNYYCPWSPTAGQSNGQYFGGKSRFFYWYQTHACTTQFFLPELNGNASSEDRVKLNCDTIRMVECLYGDPRVFAGLPNVGSEFFAPHRFYFDPKMRGAHTMRGAISTVYPGPPVSADSNFRGATEHNLMDAALYDPSWSYNAWKDSPGTIASGAQILGRKQPATTDLQNRQGAINRMGGVATGNFGSNNGILNRAPYTTSSSEFDDSIFVTTWGNNVTPFSDIWKTGGDFSNDIGSGADGPFINKPSEAGGYGVGGSTNYYPEWWFESGVMGYTLDTQFTPNRLISSPVAFGCLPARNPARSALIASISPLDAWHTLLFCPNPNAMKYGLAYTGAYTTRMASTDVTSPGAVPTGTKCPDHLLLDFFTMPVVEPYAISEPFSTAGKVNMNYQIAPFTYIQRDTALRGVFRGTMLTAVNEKFVPSKTGNETSYYKSNSLMMYGWSYINYATASDTFGDFQSGTNSHWGFRYPIHAGETLKQFKQRFDSGDIFRSPSEICSLFLYPATQPTTTNPAAPATPLVSWDTNNTNILQWWYDDPAGNRKALTGDNERERPYDTLYPRLTTKSNSYTVHFRVQVLKKIKTGDQAQWVEGKDQVLSEYRGSSLIERYIDPNDPTLPDFAKTTTDTLDNYYKFRVVTTKKFTAD